MTRFVLATIVVVASSSIAVAQPAGAQAEVLFRQGRELMTAGKVAEACSAFEQSQKLEAAVATLINLAGCREKNNQLATAWGLFLDAERQTRSGTDDATMRLHDIAQDKAHKLEPRVSKLTINVPQQSQASGLEITRGTERVDAVMWNRALPIDGGSYTITARAPGANVWTSTVTIGAEGDTKTIDVPDLRNLSRDLEPKHDDAPTTWISDTIVPLSVGAGAIVAFGGALGFELAGESSYNAAKAETTSQARRDSLYSSANTKRYVGEALLLGGAAAAGVAVWLYLRTDHEHVPTATTARVVLSPAGIALAGGF
jgi:hypothetical protein